LGFNSKIRESEKGYLILRESDAEPWVCAKASPEILINKKQQIPSMLNALKLLKIS
jgi:hypothetical protein